MRVIRDKSRLSQIRDLQVEKKVPHSKAIKENWRGALAESSRNRRPGREPSQPSAQLSGGTLSDSYEKLKRAKTPQRRREEVQRTGERG